MLIIWKDVNQNMVTLVYKHLSNTLDRLDNMFTGRKLSFADRLPFLYNGLYFYTRRKFYCLINFSLKGFTEDININVYLNYFCRNIQLSRCFCIIEVQNFLFYFVLWNDSERKWICKFLLLNCLNTRVIFMFFSSFIINFFKIYWWIFILWNI